MLDNISTEDIYDLAYSIAKSEFKSKKEFTFSELLNQLMLKSRWSKEQINSNLGSIYAGLLQDMRFVFLGNNVWTLKEYLKFAEYQEKMNSLYDFEQNDFTEDYDSSSIKKINSINNDLDLIENDPSIESDDDLSFSYDHEDEEQELEQELDDEFDDELDETDIESTDEDFE